MRNGKIYLAPNDSYEKFYLAAKGFKHSYASLSECVRVKTDVFAKIIKKCCKERSDEWSFVSLGRIEYFMSNLHPADCIPYMIAYKPRNLG